MLPSQDRVKLVSWVKNPIRFYLNTKFRDFWKITWSQHGEDVCLLSLIRNIQIRSEKNKNSKFSNLVLPSLFGHSRYSGTYLDIGCHHPRRFSNTKLFYDLGWGGVNVDASAQTIKLFEQERKRDVNLNLLIGLPGSVNFVEYEDSALNTADSALYKSYQKLKGDKFKIISKSKMKKVSLEYLLDKYFTDSRLDILFIDCEGLDFEILVSGKLHKRDLYKLPRFIVFESIFVETGNLKPDKSLNLLKSLGYITLLVLPKSVVMGIASRSNDRV